MMAVLRDHGTCLHMGSASRSSRARIVNGMSLIIYAGNRLRAAARVLRPSIRGLGSSVLRICS